MVGRMRDVGAVIGGEGNGGVIDPRVGWVRDPFVGMALILSLMAEEREAVLATGRRTAAVRDAEDEVRGAAREAAAAAFAALEQRWPDARVNREDGLRLDGPDWWLHVRGSNTEPVVRVIAEAPTEDRAKELCDEAGAIVTGKPAPRRAKAEPAVSGKKPARNRRCNAD